MPRARAFTLTEILIVIGLIVLLIALAVPTFNLIGGTRSVDSAQNQISAMLGRARSEAIGLQEIRGVFFFIEPRSDRVMAAMVREVPKPLALPPYMFSTGLAPQVDVFLDLVADMEFVALPSGVSLQVLDDVQMTSAGVRLDDAYIGFNKYNRGNSNPNVSSNDTLTPYGGVILFDSSGRLISRSYAFKTYEGTNGNATPTRMGDLLFKPTGALNAKDHVVGNNVVIYDVVPRQNPSAPLPSRPPRSSLGILLFDKTAFRNRPLNPNDTQGVAFWEADPEIYNSAAAAYGDGSQSWDEFSEENWLDENALFLLVNRYNGTLVKSE